MLPKVCVVGSGYWGENHINTLNDLGCLGGIVDSSDDRLSYFSKKIPEILTFKSIDDALEKSSFLGYTIATPAKTHFTIAKKILLKGKSVLVEKPFTTNQSEAEKLIKLSEEFSANIMVGHLMLFHPAIQKMKQLIEKKKIGNINYIYSNRINFGKVRTFENVLWSLGPHDISIFQYLLEDYPKYIVAKGSISLQKNIHDNVTINLSYKNKVSGHIFLSWLHPFKEHRLVVIGSHGMLTFEDSLDGSPLKYFDKKVEINNGTPIHIDNDYKEIVYDKKKPLKEELKYFVKQLKSKVINKSNGKHALDVTKILLEANKQIQ